MNEREVITVLAKIENNWQPFKNQRAAIELWCDRFRTDPAALVMEAVNVLIDTDTSGFRPTIGQVKAAMHDIIFGEQLSETEAWLKVKGALHEAQEEPETLGGAKRVWAKLPEDLQKLVSPRQLLEWNSIGSDQLDTVIQSNFMRSYRDVTGRKYRRETVSKDTAKAIEAIRKTAGVFKDPDEKPELPQPKRLAFEPPEWMVQRPDVRTGLEGIDDVKPIPIEELVL